MNHADADIAIIGSGFGGSVAALRAAEAGLRTIVIERGRRLDAQSDRERREVLHARYTNGPAQVHTMPGLLALTGNALGGGSQIYTAVKMPPKPEIFDDQWPEEITWQSMQPWFERVRSIIQPRTVDQTHDRQRTLETIATALNGRAEALPLAWSPSSRNDRPSSSATNDLHGQWQQWQAGGGKRPLTQTYLKGAEDAGAEFRCQTEATLIEPLSTGYRVHYQVRNDGAVIHDSIRATKVVIAAGTLNTLRLLFRCRTVADGLPKLSLALGEHFFTNGDLGAALWRGARLPQADDGPLVTAWIDLWERDRLFLMETGRFPIATANAQAPWLFGIMGDPPIDGSIAFEKGGLQHRFEQRPVSAFHRRVKALMTEAARAINARSVIVPAAVFNRRPVTVHPLGGARMAHAPRYGVVDAYQEIFGYPGLYVLDGAAIPRQLGAPPSLTIAACAERAMATMLKNA